MLKQRTNDAREVTVCCLYVKSYIPYTSNCWVFQLALTEFSHMAVGVWFKMICWESGEGGSEENRGGSPNNMTPQGEGHENNTRIEGGL